VIASGNGQSVQTRIVPRPDVPELLTPADRQLKIDAVLSADYESALPPRNTSRL